MVGLHTLRRRRLAKFVVALVVVVVAMVAIGLYAFFDAAAQVSAENRVVLAQNLMVMVATVVVGLGTVAVALVRPTIKQVEELAAHAEAIEDGNLETEIATGSDDEIGALYASMDSMRETIDARIREAEEQREGAMEAREESETQRERAVQLREESEQLASELEARTESFADTMARTAEGDLRARLDVEEDDHESLKRVAGSFNEAVDGLDEIIGDVGEFTGEVVRTSTDSTEQLDAAVADGRRASEATDAIAADARRQSEQLVETAREFETMSATVEEVAASADELADSSERAADVSEQGRGAAREAVEELHRIESRAEATADSIAELERQVDDIEEIVVTITDIAEQTNMLALNASIEAARAGGDAGSDVGEGFDVVATEVKALAEDTRESAAEVETMIADLRELTDESAKNVRTIQSDVTTGVETVEQVGDALTDIDTQVSEVDHGVQQITAAMDEQAQSLNDVTASVDELTDLSRETADEAETVSATVDDQATALEDASETTHELLASAERLQALLETFSYRETERDAASDAQTCVCVTGGLLRCQSENVYGQAFVPRRSDRCGERPRGLRGPRHARRSRRRPGAPA